MSVQESTQHSLVKRVVIGAIVFLLVLLVGISAARAVEIVPSVGVTRATDGSGDPKTFLGVALRGSLVPMVKDEIAVGYRSEEYFNGDLKVRMVPVTASVWLAPVPFIYAGGGLGLYATSLQYRDALMIPTTTDQSFGVHLGGGINLPLAPMVAVDVNSRYVFMREQASQISQSRFNPDFWSTSVGLAIKF